MLAYLIEMNEGQALGFEAAQNRFCESRCWPKQPLKRQQELGLQRYLDDHAVVAVY